MKRTIAITVAAVALVASFAVGWAVKGSASPTGTNSRLASASTSTTAGRQTPKQRYEDFVAAVAAKAGISAGTLDNAIRSVAEDRVAQAADDGRISPARAQKIETAIKDGDLGRLLHHRLEVARAHGRHPLLRLLHHWAAGR